MQRILFDIRNVNRGAKTASGRQGAPGPVLGIQNKEMMALYFLIRDDILKST